MFGIKIFMISCAIISLCDSYAVVVDPKCTVSDSDCQAKVFASALQDLSDNGDPATGLPPYDPFVIKNFELSLLGMIKLTMVEGKAVGLKKCRIDSVKTNVEASRTHVVVVCDTFNVEGQLKISTLPALETLVGGLKIHGDGPAKLDLEKVTIVLDIAYKYVKSSDGEYHIQMIPEESTHSLDVAGKATFDITDLSVGSQQIAPVATAILNENWQLVGKMFSTTLIDSIMTIFYTDGAKIFNSFPASSIISDDLSKYV